MKFKPAYVALAMTAVIFSCNTYNDHAHIALESPSYPDEYSTKLVSALSQKGGGNEFIVRGYKESGLNKYLVVEVVGDDVHAEIPLAITNSAKMASIIRTKGVSYNGAEIRGLQLSPVNDPIAKFKIDQIDRVID